MITGDRLVHLIFTAELDDQSPAFSMIGSDGAPICVVGGIVLDCDARAARDAAHAALVAQLKSPPE